MNSTTLAQIDIVFFFYDYVDTNGVNQMNTDYLFGNTASENEILTFLEGLHPTATNITINGIER